MCSSYLVFPKPITRNIDCYIWNYGIYFNYQLRCLLKIKEEQLFLAKLNFAK